MSESEYNKWMSEVSKAALKPEGNSYAHRPGVADIHMREAYTIVLSPRDHEDVEMIYMANASRPIEFVICGTAIHGKICIEIVILENSIVGDLVSEPYFVRRHKHMFRENFYEKRVAAVKEILSQMQAKIEIEKLKILDGLGEKKDDTGI